MTADSLNRSMGRADRSPFSVGHDRDGHASPSRHDRVLMFVSLGALGAGLVMLARSRGSSAQTGPQVTLTQSAAPDQSAIDNLTNSIIAIQGQSHVPSSVAPGGVSTPTDTSTSPSSASMLSQETQAVARGVAAAQHWQSEYDAAAAHKASDPSATTFTHDGTDWSLDPQSLANMLANSRQTLAATKHDAALWGVPMPGAGG